MRFEEAAGQSRQPISTSVLASYTFGLILAVLLSSAYHHPQPALLYLLPTNSQCSNQHSFNQLLKHVCLLLYSGAVFANVEAEVRAGRNIGRGLSSSALGTLVLSKTVVRANESCRVNFSGLNVTVVDCRRVVIAGNLIFFESSLLASCRTSSRRSEALSNLSRMRIIAMTQARCVQTS